MVSGMGDALAQAMIAVAKDSGSPALDALVRGHIAAGRVGMAALALRLSPDALSALDAVFAEAKDGAAALGMLMAAHGNE